MASGGMYGADAKTEAGFPMVIFVWGWVGLVVTQSRIGRIA